MLLTVVIRYTRIAVIPKKTISKQRPLVARLVIPLLMRDKDSLRQPAGVCVLGHALLNFHGAKLLPMNMCVFDCLAFYKVFNCLEQNYSKIELIKFLTIKEHLFKENYPFKDRFFNAMELKLRTMWYANASSNAEPKLKRRL